MKVEGSQVGLTFGILWMLLNTVGWPIGYLMGFALGSIIGELVEPIWGSVLGEIPSYFMFGGALGAVIGLMQWFVLRRQILRAGWWILASAFSLAVVGGAGIAVAAVTDYSVGLGNYAVLCRWVAVAGLGGVVAGIFQRLILRQQVSRANWWVLASTLGWALSIFVQGGLIVGRTVREGLTISRQISACFGGGVALAVVTVVAMVCLLRQPVKKA